MLLGKAPDGLVGIVFRQAEVAQTFEFQFKQLIPAGLSQSSLQEDVKALKVMI